MAFDPKKLTPLDWAIVGGGIVVFIAMFMPWWGYDAGLISASVSGWSTGFTGWFGGLLLIAAAVYVALRRAEVSLPDLPIGPAVTAAGAAVIGLAFVLLRWLTMPRRHIRIGTSRVGYGAKFGIWLAILAGIVEAAAAVVELRSSGEPVPWDKTP